MKRTTILLAALLMTAVAIAQEETAAPKLTDGTWTHSTTPALKASEFLFKNWSQTGNSQIDVTGTFFGNYKFTNPKYVWDNVIDLAYGYAWSDLETGDTLFETRRKSNDKIDLTSALSWNAYKGWGASLTANMKTQFGNGYNYTATGSLGEATKEQVSAFFAPAYLTTALSFEHKKNDWSVSLSFLTGKTTFVCNDTLLQHGYTYGVIQKDDNYMVNHNYTHVYFALGSYIKAQYLKKNILPNMDLYARVELFYDYRKPGNMAWDSIAAGRYEATEYRGYEYGADRMDRLQAMSGNWLKKRIFETDVDFELKVDYRLSSHIAANFALNMKYDTDFSGFGPYGHWQLYQMAGVQVFFNWEKK